MTHKLILQLEKKVKLEFGIKNKNCNLKSLVTLIMVFMTSLDKIQGKKLVFYNYFDLMKIFLDNLDILELDPKDYCKHLETLQWETDYMVYSFTVLNDIKTFINEGKLESGNFAWFDQTASGPSIIAILSNSEKLAYYSNMTTVGDKQNYQELQRNCIYSEFLNHCNASIPSLNNANFADFKFDRKWAKYTLMSHYYSAGLRTISQLVSD